MSQKSYYIVYTEFPEYLYAYVEGENDSPAISRQYWSEVTAECARLGKSKLLIHENIEENVSATEMFEFTKELPKMIPPTLKVAFVDRQKEHQSLNHFGEIVANNRGLRSRVFDSVDEAAIWLLAD